MKNNTYMKHMIQTDLQSSHSMRKTYEIKLNLTADEISSILDFCLAQKIEHSSDDIEQYMNIAENIRSDKLSDEFCRYFANELTPVVKELVGNKSDSYLMSNFQHRMLRKFSHIKAVKKIA